MILEADNLRGKIVHTIASLVGSIGALYLQAVIDEHTIFYRVKHNGRIKKKSLQPRVAIAFYNGVVARAKLGFSPVDLPDENVNVDVTHVLASHAGSAGTLHLEVATECPNVLYRVRRNGRIRMKSLSLDVAVDFYNMSLGKQEKKVST